MIQQVNGVKLMMMVRERPVYEAVARAAMNNTSFSLETVSYANLVESAGSFELVNIRGVRLTDDGFRFKGSIVGMDFDVDPKSDEPVSFVKLGNALVIVDEHGASMQFVINLQVCVM